MKRLALALAALFALDLAACQADLCADEPASLQLDVGYAGPAVTELRLAVEIPDHRWVKTFPVAGQLDDGATSLAIVLDPAPTQRVELRVTATALDASGAELASAQQTQVITADGCNSLRLNLTAPRPDAGASDGDAGAMVEGDARAGDGAPAADATAGADAGPGNADASPGDATPNPADQGVRDTGGAADALPAPDAAARDAAAPDAMIDAGPPPPMPVPFAFTPTNFSPGTLRPLVTLAVDCGRVVTFDSDALTFRNACGAAPTAVTQAQPNGPEAAVIPALALRVTSGSTLEIVGSRPTIIAVFGDADVQGAIRSNAAGTRAGAGGSNAAACANIGTGGTSATRGGAGGGGFGSVGGRGGRGGDGRGGGDGGLVAPRIEALSPLRGGCSGGTNALMGSGGGGAGGGAVQISASRNLVLGGVVQATGGGGGGGASRAGGGGGGSGGAIFLEANTLTVTAAGVADTRGGGGGGGGENGNAAGSAGQDGSTMAPSGGPGGGSSGGAGGDGADGLLPAASGERGNSSGSGVGGGGGGGGGGAGRVRLRGVGQCQSQGTILPPTVGC